MYYLFHLEQRSEKYFVCKFINFLFELKYDVASDIQEEELGIESGPTLSKKNVFVKSICMYI